MSQKAATTNATVGPLNEWKNWRRRNSVTAGLLSGVRVNDPTSYFLRTHAVTEALLRRALLVGLRKKGARYSDAKQWLEENDNTPDRVHYPRKFNALYGPANAWTTIAAPQSDFEALWVLWLDFSKILRNHLAHGLRTYGNDWLRCGTHIDQAFCMEFTAALVPIIGGELGADLRKLSPRLGMGVAGTNISQLIGQRTSRPRPTISLQTAEANFQALGIT